MKVRPGNARSLAAIVARGLTVLVTSAALTLGPASVAPASATSATTATPAQAAVEARDRVARQIRATAIAEGRVRAAAIRAERAAKAKSVAAARARARVARAHARLLIRLARMPKPAPAPRPAKAPAVKWLTAKVSWYGPGFYGHGMAGGGILRPTSMVVAHRTLPFGTRIEFSFRGKTVIAAVKDRGPFVAGRTFDLGPGVAVALGFDHVSVGQIHYRIL